MAENSRMDVWPREVSSGSGSKRLYSVQARVKDGPPVSMGAQSFDGEWRPVQFNENSPIGIPSNSHHGLHEHTAAEGLRWWFLAEADRARFGFLLETRLVRHTVHETHKIVAECPIDEVGSSTYRHCDRNEREQNAIAVLSKEPTA